MAVETSLGATTTIPSQIAKPRFVAEEFATTRAVAEFLNRMAAQDYHMVSITPITQTNHFNKDYECTVWVIMERNDENGGHLPRH